MTNFLILLLSDAGLMASSNGGCVSECNEMEELLFIAKYENNNYK